MSVQDKFNDFQTKLEENLTGVEPFDLVQKHAKINRAHAAMALAASALLFVFFGVGAGLVTNLVGFLYPAYMSFKAIESDDTSDDTLWLTYWVVYATFTVLESFSSFILSWIPFYYVAKLGFIVWSMHPSTRGAVTVYKSLISPFMKQHEATFDRAGAAAAGAASSAASSVATEGARYVASNASTIASGVATGLSAAEKRAGDSKKSE